MTMILFTKNSKEILYICMYIYWYSNINLLFLQVNKMAMILFTKNSKEMLYICIYIYILVKQYEIFYFFRKLDNLKEYKKGKQYTLLTKNHHLKNIYIVHIEYDSIYTNVVEALLNDTIWIG